MSDNIPPYEIQLEIIKKVSDVKSLLRFRAVSKQWKFSIDSSEFIAGYGARDTQPHRLLLRYKEIINPREFKYISFIDDATFPQQQQDFVSNVPLLIKQLKDSNVIGSSCGLWCLYDYLTLRPETVVIWNPSIRKSVGVVVPSVLRGSYTKITHYGFGVCPSTCDPAIVAISLQRKYKPNMMSSVGIFTLSSKTWKMMPTSNVPRETISFGYTTQVAIDRFIFWVAYDRIIGNDGVLEFKKLILSFDLITQEFKEVHLPVSIANQVSQISVFELNESLGVSAYEDEVNDGLVYGIWMMGEASGVITSFTKLFNIKVPDSSIWMFGFTKRSEPIMETLTKGDTGSTKIKVYEPYSKHINDIGFTGILGSFFICPYTETLLLVDHSDSTIFSNDC